jgi:hypothetical protein
MVALKTTATVDASRTLAVRLPQCGMEAREYEVLVFVESIAPAKTGGGNGDFESWLKRAAGSSTSGLSTGDIMAATRGED